MSISTVTLCSALLLLFAPLGLAQQTGSLSPLDDYAVDVWSTDQGLPQNSVNTITQTPDGYLWLGTYGGLVRFDGVRFTLIPRRDSIGSHLDRITALSVAPDGALWIGTERGLLRYHNGVYRSWREGAAGTQQITQVFADEDGSVWFMAGGQLLRYRKERFQTVVEAGAAGALKRDGTGVLWLGDAQNGIRRNGQAIAYPNLHGVFHFDDGAVRWFSIGNGSVTRVDSSGLRVGRAYQLGAASPHFFGRDGAGDYWIGTIATGLFLFRPDHPERNLWKVPLPAGINNYDLRAMHIDAEGTLWAGTNGQGLIRVQRKLFRVVTASADVPKVMTALMQDKAGRMLLGTNCTGLYVLQPGTQQATPFDWPPGDAPSCILSLTEDTRGGLWVGSYDRLIRVADGRTETVRDADGESLTGTQALHTARDGTVWAGFLRGGLLAFPAQGPPRRFGAADGLRNPDVRFITSDPDGTIWLGTTGGLGRLVEQRISWYTSQDGLPANFVRSVYRSADGTHWIGTYGGGLARLKAGRFARITQDDGLADNVVSSILEDDAGNLWMTGNRGIYRVRRSELDAFADGDVERVHAVLYGRGDGLLNVETNGGFSPAAWRTRTGQLWFPTLSGAASVDPARAVFSGAAPRTVIEEVFVDRQLRPVAGELRVERGRHDVEIHYTGLSLSAPEHISFRYRLIGYADDWDVVGPRRAAYYPRLPPGRYRFEVQAANRDGVWSEAGVLPVRVLPHIWQMLWFQLLAIGVLLGLVTYGIAQRMRALRRAHEAQLAFARRFLEGQESERRRVAGELHDSIGQGLLIAKNRAALALRRPDLQPEVRAQLDQIVGVVSDTLEEARQISHNLRPPELDRLGLSAAVVSAVEQASASSGTEITVDVSDADGALDPNAEIAAFRIVQEGLSNILKHSAASAARIRITRLPGQVRLIIHDNGRGLTNTSDGGFGLAGIRERTNLLGGTCEIQSTPGNGTTITIMLPSNELH